MTTISPKAGYVRVFNWSNNIFGRPFVPLELLELDIMYYCMKTRFDIDFFVTRNKKDTFDCAHMAKATRVNKLSIRL